MFNCQPAFRRCSDGEVNAPLYYHNAVLYAMHGLQFVNPEFEGIFNTLGQDLMPHIADPTIGLAVVSRAIFNGRLFHVPTGKRVKWVPGKTAEVSLQQISWSFSFYSCAFF
jgi:hypothetical protein